ncbi:thioredoxin-dependent thiol peroxidase [Salinisphaera sp.]|uniref:thioredoxin-dependent thiol peroxidase n=1 Tax=Salinisphaera sp. TaxID=1914330 RepID=UPI002D776281|nr:thioredoxin-dependent thiol peroxidase [Salinisphaera sp.]HET7315656.1 thioredoxin-dependent thiol peroxidase [Salinisphaera sp.]
MTNQLTAGQKAPDFELVDDQGRTVTLGDYRGRTLIVYFFPKAETPGCTTEACDFRDNITSLASAGYDVVGVSPDEPEALRGFRDNHHLTFPLLSDPTHRTIEAWGAWGEKTRNGKTVTGVIRSTIVVNAEGLVELAKYHVDAEGHVAALRSELEMM